MSGEIVRTQHEWLVEMGLGQATSWALGNPRHSEKRHWLQWETMVAVSRGTAGDTSGARQGGRVLGMAKHRWDEV